MGRRQQHDDDFEYEDDLDEYLGNDEYDFEVDQLHEQIQSYKKTRKKGRTRDARRRIEEYWEERDLASRLSEYYDR